MASRRCSLHAITAHGHRECWQQLLASGADANQAQYDGSTPLIMACQHGHSDCVQQLLASSADVNQAQHDGRTPLFTACMNGHSDCVQQLLASGADVNQARDDGATPLIMACQKGNSECVQQLLASSAAVNQAQDNGGTPLLAACQQGHHAPVMLLSSYNAKRDSGDWTAEQLAEHGGHAKLLAWLQESREWTPLHHLEVLTADRTRALLRGGADLRSGSPSPLELAQHTEGEASALVRQAACWSEGSHHLFPATARVYAVEVMRVGYLLAWSPRYVAEAASLVDVWRDNVLPHAVNALRLDA